MADRRLFPTLNLLDPESCESSSDYFQVQGFGDVEGGTEARWRWGFGPSAKIRISNMPIHGVRLRAQIRAPHSPVQISWEGVTVAEIGKRDAKSLELLLSADSGMGSLEFASSPFLANEDERPLAFVIESGVLVPAFETVGRICPYPFSRMELPGEPFIPCCKVWMRPEYFELPSGPDPWNGPAAEALRASIHDGSYRYCYLDRCGTKLIHRKNLADHAADPGELPISSRNLAAAVEGATVLPEGPSAATLMGDSRCNLACASCRSKKITTIPEEEEPRLEKMNSLYSQYAPKLEILKLAGDGEVFFSPALRKTVQEAILLPELRKLDVLTNGILFDSTALEDLKPGSDRIRSVSVSIDAGDPETYRVVRNGNWNRLLQNLRWMSEMRRERRFDFLGLAFVLRKANYRSLPAFLDLAEVLGVDEVYVSRLLPWDRMLIRFEEEAVSEFQHTEYRLFRDIWEKERARMRSFRWRTNIV